MFEPPGRRFGPAEWEFIDRVDPERFISPEGLPEAALGELAEAVDVIANHATYEALPPLDGASAEAQAAVEMRVGRLERALAIMRLGVDLQSQRYDERVAEADYQDAENESLRLEVGRLRSQLEEAVEARNALGTAGMDAAELLRANDQLGTALRDAEEARYRTQERLAAAEDEARARIASTAAHEQRVRELEDRLAEADREMQTLRAEADAQQMSLRGRDRGTGGRGELDLAHTQVRRLLRDNADLDRANKELRGAKEALSGELAEASAAAVQLAQEAQEWNARESELRVRADEASSKLRVAESNGRDMKETIAGHLAQFSALEATFERNYRLWEGEKISLEERVAELTRQVEAAVARGRSGVQDGRAATPAAVAAGVTDGVAATVDGDDRSETSSGDGPVQGKTLARLGQELRAAQEREVVLMEAYEELEQNVAVEIDAALAEERKRVGEDGARVGALATEAERGRKREADLAAEVKALEEKLTWAEDKCRKYEAGHGLEDAAAEIDRWRADALSRDHALNELLSRSNDLSDAVEALSAENEALRLKAGVPEGAAVDVSAVRRRGREELEQLRRLASHLEAELGEREESELRLRHELRYRVKWGGGAAARMGLTEHQVVFLEETIARLKEGSDRGLGFGTSPEQRTLARLEERLSRSEAMCRRLKQAAALPEEELEALVRAMTAGVGASGGVDDGDSVRGHGRMGAGGSAVPRRLLEALRVAVERARTEIAALTGETGGALAHLDVAAAKAGEALRQVSASASGAIPVLPLSQNSDMHHFAAPVGSPVAPAVVLPTSLPSNAGADAVRELFRARAEELALLQADLAERDMAISVMQRERDALRDRLRGDYHGGDCTGFVSVAEFREAEETATSLRAQLLETLEAAVAREREAAATEEELERARVTMQTLLDQRSLLYREHARHREARDAEAEKLRSAAAEAADRVKVLDKELALAHRSLAALRPVNPEVPHGEDVARLANELATRTQALVRAEVGVVRLGRRLALSEAGEARAKRRVRDADSELREMSSILRARLDQVSRSRDEALRRVTALQSELDSTCPVSVLAELEARYASLERNYRGLLSSRAGDGTETRASNAELDRLREELSIADRRWSEAALRAERLTLARAGSDNTAAIAAAPNVGDTNEERVRAKIALEASEARVERVQREADASRRALTELEGIVKALESDLASALGEAQGERDRASEATAKMAAMLTPEVATALRERVDEAERARAEADTRLEAERSRAEMAEAALATARGDPAGNLDQTATLAELNILRDCVRDMAQRTDAATTIGRYAEEAIETRRGESVLRAQLVRSERDRERLTQANLSLERAGAHQSQELMALGARLAEARSRAARAESRLALVRARTVERSRAERWALAAAGERRRVRWTEGVCEELRTEVRAWAERAEEAAEARDAQAHAAAVSAGPESEARKEVARVREQLGRARLERSKADRSGAVERSRADFLSRVNADLEDRLTALERAGLEETEAAERARAEAQMAADAAGEAAEARGKEVDELRAELATLRAGAEAGEVSAALGLSRRRFGGAEDAGTMSAAERDALLDQVDRHMRGRLELEESKARVLALTEELQARDARLAIVETDAGRAAEAAASAARAAGALAEAASGKVSPGAHPTATAAFRGAGQAAARGTELALAREVDRLEERCRRLEGALADADRARLHDRTQHTRAARALGGELSRAEAERDDAVYTDRSAGGAASTSSGTRFSMGRTAGGSVRPSSGLSRAPTSAADDQAAEADLPGLVEAVAVVRDEHMAREATLEARCAALERELEEARDKARQAGVTAAQALQAAARAPPPRPAARASRDDVALADDRLGLASGGADIAAVAGRAGAHQNRSPSPDPIGRREISELRRQVIQRDEINAGLKRSVLTLQYEIRRLRKEHFRRIHGYAEAAASKTDDIKEEVCKRTTTLAATAKRRAEEAATAEERADRLATECAGLREELARAKGRAAQATADAGVAARLSAATGATVTASTVPVSGMPPAATPPPVYPAPEQSACPPGDPSPRERWLTIKVSELRAEIKGLRAEGVRLRSRLARATTAAGSDAAAAVPDSETAPPTSADAGASAREESLTRWTEGKRLTRRITTLETRLKEAIEERDRASEDAERQRSARLRAEQGSAGAQAAAKAASAKLGRAEAAARVNAEAAARLDAALAAADAARAEAAAARANAEQIRVALVPRASLVSAEARADTSAAQLAEARLERDRLEAEAARTRIERDAAASAVSELEARTQALELEAAALRRAPPPQQALAARAPSSVDSSALLAERDSLAAEVTRLRNDLGALDDDFWNWLHDLKYEREEALAALDRCTCGAALGDAAAGGPAGREGGTGTERGALAPDE